MAEARVRIGPDRQWEKLLLLKEMTRTTGILHELQVLQLKMWPLVFANAKDSECEFGFETKHVVFKLKALVGKRPKNLKQRLEHLAHATQQLLGEEYAVTVYLAGKKVFHGKQTGDA